MGNYRTTISSKGQVVIPAELRERFDLEKGTQAVWSENEGRLILTPITPQRLNEIMGFLKPKPGGPSAFEASLEEREKERRRGK